MTDRWMDDGHSEGRMHRKIMLLSHSLTVRGSNVSSLGGNSLIDRWTYDRHTKGPMHRNIMLLLQALTMKGSNVASLVEFHPVD